MLQRLAGEPGPSDQFVVHVFGYFPDLNIRGQLQAPMRRRAVAPNAVRRGLDCYGAPCLRR
jgi:hypothetical protein